MPVSGEPRCPHCGGGLIGGPPPSKPGSDMTSKRPHKCPVCHGVGSVPQGFYNQFGLSTSTGRERCLACGGNGIIVA